MEFQDDKAAGLRRDVAGVNPVAAAPVRNVPPVPKHHQQLSAVWVCVVVERCINYQDRTVFDVPVHWGKVRQGIGFIL